MFLFKNNRAAFAQAKNSISKYAAVINIGLSLMTLVCCFIMFERGSRVSMASICSMELKYIVLNILTIGILWSIFLVFFNRVWLSCLLCVYISGIIAIINHYVIMYHGMPLSFLVLKNFTTAMHVASSYRFSVDATVYQLLATIVIMTVLCALSGIYLERKLLLWRQRWLRDAFLAAMSVLVILVGYTGNNPMKPPKTISWLWSEPYYEYGFVPCTIESFYQSLNPITKPEGYTAGSINEIDIPPANEHSAAPDVILILNETFYDLRQIADFTTDIHYLQNIETMENALTGYAIVPVSGGATNSSEYELLTSNSMQLMPGITPFNTLDLYGANSIASYLNGLGYSTIGSHPESAVNYSREQGYYALGFQKTYFAQAFQYKEQYHNRYFVTDQSIYRSLLRWYEESPADAPRFQYLLTIQNHGAYEANEPEHDIVHVQEDFGEYTEMMNEFLSCIYLSDQAFKELTDYFSNVNRPVIVCMVGDHSPVFAQNIVDETYGEMEKQLRLRKVPLVIWANFELEQIDLGTMSLNYVVPTLLNLAEIPASPYYRYMMQIKEQIPIITSYGYYYDSDGNLYEYDNSNVAHKKILDDYFKLEYYNVQRGKGHLLFK